METKVCNKCFEEKSLDSFHRDKGKKDGLCTLCKSCKNDNAKSWRLANLDYARKKGLEYYHEKSNALISDKRGKITKRLGERVTLTEKPHKRPGAGLVNLTQLLSGWQGLIKLKLQGYTPCLV